jgi:hypothetical protein
MTIWRWPGGTLGELRAGRGQDPPPLPQRLVACAPTRSPGSCRRGPDSSCWPGPAPRATAGMAGPGWPSIPACPSTTGCCSVATGAAPNWPVTAATYPATCPSPSSCGPLTAGGPWRRTSQASKGPGRPRRAPGPHLALLVSVGHSGHARGGLPHHGCLGRVAAAGAPAACRTPETRNKSREMKGGSHQSLRCAAWSCLPRTQYWLR